MVLYIRIAYSNWRDPNMTLMHNGYIQMMYYERAVNMKVVKFETLYMHYWDGIICQRMKHQEYTMKTRICKTWDIIVESTIFKEVAYLSIFRRALIKDGIIAIYLCSMFLDRAIVFPFQCWVLKQGHYWSLVWRETDLEIEPEIMNAQCKEIKKDINHL